MDEKLYKKVKGIGASNLAFGIITLVFGITAGVMLIVNGARLLAHKSDSLIQRGLHEKQKNKKYF